MTTNKKWHLLSASLWLTTVLVCLSTIHDGPRGTVFVSGASETIIPGKPDTNWRRPDGSVEASECVGMGSGEAHDTCVAVALGLYASPVKCMNLPARWPEDKPDPQFGYLQIVGGNDVCPEAPGK